jgi:protein-disulfide isomerase
MIKTKQLIIIFIPAIVVVFLFFIIRVVQYEPLYPKTPKQSKTEATPNFVPIYPEDPIIGQKQAGITIIAFEDLGCDHCKEQLSVFFDLVEKHPTRVKVIWKGLPITRFPVSSVTAHAYAICANKQNKFFEFVNTMLAPNTNLGLNNLAVAADQAGLDKTILTQCLASNIPVDYQAKTEALAQSLGLKGVPVTFIDNQRIATEPTSVDGWKELLGL